MSQIKVPTEPFSTQYLSELLGSTIEHVEKCKIYMRQYFFKTHSGLFFYNSEIRVFESIEEKNLSRYLPNGLKMKYFDFKISKEKPLTFNCRQWFVDENYLNFKLILKLGAPSINYDNNTINLMGLELHPKCDSKYESFPTKTKNNVQLMLDHIKRVWCSGKDSQFEYILTWLSCIGKRKIKSCLYLQSLEQSGKTIVIEFLENYVYGKYIVLKTEKIESLLHYTSPLEGKVLVNVNEMPCATTGEWKKLQNVLKSLITDSTFDCRAMYKDTRTTTNTFMMILTSNNDAVALSSSNFRRYKCPDVSDEMIGNNEYFNKIVDSTYNNECGKAFNVFLQERFDKFGKCFDENSFPKTDTFKDKICDKLDSTFKFIKYEYIQTNKSFDMVPLRDLYEEFKYWNQSQTGFKQTITNMIFSKKLKQLKCVTYKRITDSNGKKSLCFSGSADELLKEFSKKGWIHELDEINEGKEQEQKPKIVNNINITIVNEKGVVQSNDGWILKEVESKTTLYKSEEEEEESEDDTLFGNFKKCGKVSL